MENALTATVVLAGLFFSLTFALLLEELLFGVVFRLMACSQRIAAGMQAQEHAGVSMHAKHSITNHHITNVSQGERPCSQ